MATNIQNNIKFGVEFQASEIRTDSFVKPQGDVFKFSHASQKWRDPFTAVFFPFVCPLLIIMESYVSGGYCGHVFQEWRHGYIIAGGKGNN